MRMVSRFLCPAGDENAHGGFAKIKIISPIELIRILEEE
jgi:hypothetical protein